VKTIVTALAIAASASAAIAPASAQTLPGGFVFLRDIDPTIIQDIRYAGSNNFVGRPLAGYGAAECVVKRDVGMALKRIQQEFAPQKLSLKMLDCYRPARAVHDMVVWGRDGRETPAGRRYNPAFSKEDMFRLGYIATHSGHSTGAAVDLTLVDLTADSSAAVRCQQELRRLHRWGGYPRPGRKHRYGHRLRLCRPQGAYQGATYHTGSTPMAERAGCRHGEARFCELLEGVVALFAAGRRRTRL